MRYFIVVMLGKSNGSEATLTFHFEHGCYPPKRELERIAKEKYDTVNAVILNIMELSKQDFASYIS